MLRCFAMLIGLMTLAACSTPYQEMGLLGGVSATQIDATTMRVSARGNAFTDVGQIKNYVLLKAAQETLGHGYSLFLVSDAEDASRTETVSIPHVHSEMVVGFGNVPGVGPVQTIGTANYTTTTEQSY